MTTRRALIVHLPAAALAGAFLSRAAFAADKSITIGINVPLTGSDAEVEISNKAITQAVDGGPC